jgi:hypothetical protein
LIIKINLFNIFSIFILGESDRSLTLEEFKNRIEAELAGSVVKVLSDGNTEESIKFVEMFKKIDRVSQMKSYYGTLQQENFIRIWQDISGAVENSENPRFLFDFYESLLSSWSKQIRWHKEVFNSDGVSETVQVICDTLSSLSPSRENVISGYLKRINEKMELLQEVRRKIIKNLINFKKKFKSIKKFQKSKKIF